MKKFKNWWAEQKADLTHRLASYPKKRFFLAAFLSGLLLGGLWLVWSFINHQPLITAKEYQLMKKLQTLRSPCLDSFFQLVSFLGSGYFITFFSLVLMTALVKKRRKRAASVLLFSLSGSGLLVYLLKNFFDRERPFACLNGPGDDGCLSFPSGHATIAFYFYGLLAYFIFRFLKLSLRKRWLIFAGLTTLVFLICFSRIYLGVHYPTDVIGGFLLGSTWLFVAIILIDFLYQ